MEKDCIFCKIIRGEIPSKKIYEDKKVLIFDNIHPVAEIHYLAIPKKHVDTFLDMKDWNDLLTPVQKLIKDKKIHDDYKLVINGGKYLAVKHFHLHILAGKLEDENDILAKT